MQVSAALRNKIL